MHRVEERRGCQEDVEGEEELSLDDRLDILLE